MEKQDNGLDSALESETPGDQIDVRESVRQSEDDMVSAEDTTPKFQISDLNFYYDQFRALTEVNMEIPRNQAMALIGPSGCGKSTFLRVLNRMNDVIPNTRTEGVVMYEDMDIYREFDVIELRKRIGMVFQKPNPFPMTVFDNVAYGPRVHGTKSKTELEGIVERSLKQAALWEEVKDRIDKPALGLSGGQQQRLCIARAIAVEPDVILMDEPTSALDPISTSKIEDLVFSLKKSFTIVIVTHNMQQAGRVSDQTAFFFEGRIVESGTTREIFFDPKEKQTEAYISGRFG